MNDSTLHIDKDKKLGQLKDILHLLQTNLEEFREEVDSSYELLKIGERTTLSKKLEKKLNNPVTDLLGAFQNFA